GITGAATAAAVASRGLSVVVLDKEAGPAREGSGRAQGSLRLQGRHASEFPLAVEALGLWNRAAADDPAIDIELRVGGTLYFCTLEKERPVLDKLIEEAHACGLNSVEYLDADRTREVVPAATGDFLGAMWSPVDAQCQPDKGTGLFVARAERAGASFAYGIRATRLVERGGVIVGVDTTAGRIDAGAVVVGAGIWTAHILATVGLRLPIMPVCLTELETQPVEHLFGPSIRAFGFGARQRPSGEMVVSGGLNARLTRRFSLYDCNGLRYWLPRARTFRKNLRLRPDGRQILREVRRLETVHPALIPDPSLEPRPDRASVDAALTRLSTVIPAAKSATAVRYWGGMVDMTPDGLPLIDGHTGVRGLTVIAGLCGHGLALGPVLGEIAADLALDGTTHRPIDSFRLGRFSGAVPPPEMMI
ncbi:MAG: NAD(P)/FAD-dependent oxidoreductase, partial [Ilumatobacteraceae bacterium]